MKEEMLQVWAAYHLQVIGEAAARLSPSLRARMRQLPWPHYRITQHYCS
jgi:uncharacterized protein with HEPN domain